MDGTVPEDQEKEKRILGIKIPSLAFVFQAGFFFFFFFLRSSLSQKSHNGAEINLVSEHLVYSESEITTSAAMETTLLEPN